MFSKLLAQRQAIEEAIRPLEDAVDVVDGFTELEFREAAATSLGADVVAGMTLAQLVDLFNDE